MCACRFWTKFLLTKTKSACWNFFHKFSFWILNWNPKKQNWYLSVTDLFLPIGILIWLKKSSGKCHKKWWWWYMSIIMIMKNSTKFNSSKSDWLIHYPTILLDWKEKYDFPFLIMIIIIPWCVWVNGKKDNMIKKITIINIKQGLSSIHSLMIHVIILFSSFRHTPKC